MKPAPFRYHDPSELHEAVTLLSQCENAKVLAGGQSLAPMLNMRFATPDHLIDLNRIADLAGLEERDGHLRVGAMTRQRDLEFSPLVARLFPAIPGAMKLLGHRQTRNRGTIGGSLCHLDPAAELVCLCSALDATVEAVGPEGARDIPFSEFPLAYMTPAIGPDEIVVAIRLPLWPSASGSAFFEFSRRRGDFAIVSAAAFIALDPQGRIARASLAIGGADVAPQRMAAVEGGLCGSAPTPELLEEAAQACRCVEALDDPYASAQYRKRLAGVMARRALVLAVERAQSAAAA